MNDKSIKIMNYELRFIDSSLLIKRDSEYIVTLPGVLLDKPSIKEVYREVTNSIVMSSAYIDATHLFNGEIRTFVCEAYAELFDKNREEVLSELDTVITIIEKDIKELDEKRIEYIDILKSETSSEIFSYLPEIIKKEMIVRHYETRYTELVKLMKVMSK